MFLATHCFSQTAEWTLLKEDGDVEVYYKIVQCESQSMLNPLSTEEVIAPHSTFQLKVVNANSTSSSITFHAITKLTEAVDPQTVSVSPGTSVVESCEKAPKLILTQKEGDQYPVSVTEFLEVFKITINQ